MSAVSDASAARGWLVAPEWWRRGVRTPLWWAALVVFVVSLTTDLAFGSGRLLPTGGSAVYAVSTLAETVVGLLFWMWRPRSLLGPLLYLWPQIQGPWGNVNLVFPHSRLTATLVALLWWLCFGVYVHMLFAFPSGKVYSRRAVPLVAWFYVMVVLWNIPVALFTRDGGVGTAVPLTFVGHGWSHLHVWTDGREVVAIATTLVVDAFLAVRLWRASPGVRRRIVPLYAQWFVFWNFAIIYHSTAEILNGPALPGWWNNYVNESYALWSAIGAAFGLAVVRRARGSSVADLVVELGRVEPGRVREALARSLGDPNLTLGLWLPDRHVLGRRAGQRRPGADQRRARSDVRRRTARRDGARPRPARPAEAARGSWLGGAPRARERAVAGRAASAAG
jgi:hypothetical protein